ncbi:hypothetical protein [Streptomyces luteireticuli]|uniref:hypothetical protein n=1 Tax=Streptomyces luteireticuli TaxID=173858 RepID=UPI00355774A4
MSHDLSDIPTGVPLTVEQFFRVLAAGQSLPAPWADEDPGTAQADEDVATAELFRDLQIAHPVTDGGLAEQRHLLDADPDTCLPLPGIPGDAERGRS